MLAPADRSRPPSGLRIYLQDSQEALALLTGPSPPADQRQRSHASSPSRNGQRSERAKARRSRLWRSALSASMTPPAGDNDTQGRQERREGRQEGILR